MGQEGSKQLGEWLNMTNAHHTTSGPPVQHSSEICTSAWMTLTVWRQSLHMLAGCSTFDQHTVLKHNLLAQLPALAVGTTKCHWPPSDVHDVHDVHAWLSGPHTSAP